MLINSLSNIFPIIYGLRSEECQLHTGEVSAGGQAGGPAKRKRSIASFSSVLTNLSSYSILKLLYDDNSKDS